MSNIKANEKVGANYVVDPSRTRSVSHPIANYGTGNNYIRVVKATGGVGDDFGNDFGDDFS